MDALIAKANAIQPLAKRRKTQHGLPRKDDRKSRTTKTSESDPTLVSIAKNAAIPKSLRTSSPLPENVPTHSHIPNKKLRTQLNRTSAHAARSKALLKDAELFLNDEAGEIEVEGEMEKTWRVGQDEIVKGAGQEAAKGRREWKLDGGPYRSRYTRNGRQVNLLTFPPLIRVSAGHTV
jgi:U3 small nucleolar RNA-associated protein 7